MQAVVLVIFKLCDKLDYIEMKPNHHRPSWIRYSSPIGRFYEAYACLSALLKEKNIKPLILDAGCGFGELELFIETVGCDIDSQALRYAKKVCKNESEFVSASLLHLPFRHETFSAIAMLDVLEHVRHEVVVLEHSFCILKSGGLILITVPLEIGKANMLDLNYFRLQHKHYNEYELPELLKKMGFSKVSSSRRGSIVIDLFGYLITILDKISCVVGARFRIATEPLNRFLYKHGPLKSQLVISAVKAP